MKKHWLTMAAALSFSACGSPTEPGPPTPIESLPRPLTASEETLIARSNGFGHRLLAEVVASDGRPNIFLSPLSASMALGMTLNGAVDDTFLAMRSTLGFETLDQEQINESYRGLLDLLSDLDPQVTFEIANAIWANRDYTFHQSFFDAVRTAFDARVESADFGDATTLDDINGWVAEQTNGKITEILEQLDPVLVMLLLNAMYFDGSWTSRFDPDDTGPAPFTRPDGSEVTVDMMSQVDGEFALGGGVGFRAIELPYGGGAFTMVVLLPDDGDARGLARTMDEARWDDLTASLFEGRVSRLSMPKLALTYDTFLNQPLSDMGMEVAFIPAADFSGMSPGGDQFCIDFVRQKTFLEVDERGTRAAAVTVVGIGPTSAPPSFVVDRPFLFAIRERLSGTILFSGVVEDPTAEASDPEEAPSRCR